MKRKLFLLSFEFEADLTVWRISDDDLQDLIKTVFRTIGAGHTEGPIPRVAVRKIRDEGEVDLGNRRC